MVSTPPGREPANGASENPKVLHEGRWLFFGSTASDRLGTDPTNAGSVFRVMNLTRDCGTGARLLWSAAPGQTYRVQR